MDDLAPTEIYMSLQSRDQHRVWGAVASYTDKSVHRLRAGGNVHIGSLMGLASDPNLAATLDVTHLTDFSKKIMESLSKVPDYEDQVGVAIINMDGVYGIELFDSPESWKALGKEVIKSFSEIFHQDERIADLFSLNMDAVKDKVRNFLKELDGITYQTGDGTFSINNNPLVIGEYTNLNGECIHITVSRNDTNPVKPDSGIPIVPNIYSDMFSNSQRPYRSQRRRYASPPVGACWEGGHPLYDRDWEAKDMDSVIVPPVKKPKIGDGLIFGRLMERSYAFNDLQLKTGIPSSTLARRLNEYTEDGYITKTDEDGHAKWKLTARGVVTASEKQQ
jgi:hypothetical protein